MKLKWHVIQGMVKNMQGRSPDSEHAVKNAVERVSAAGKLGIATTKYANSGRRYGADGGKWKLTELQTKKVLLFFILHFDCTTNTNVSQHQTQKTKKTEGDGFRAQVEEQTVLHVPLHQERAQVGGKCEDHCSNLEQAHFIFV